MSGILHARCHCGRLIVRNDAEKKISHEAPECDFFRKMLARAAAHTREVEVIDPETGLPPKRGMA